ncbi:hypothetical protein [Streptomyces mexicanus]|uniref:hypothetical protein n=1 Tax=Streptomyces mexicanus TaxID=178566 RepID=UPI003652D17F
MPVDLDSVAGELYGLRPEDFTAARDERAAAARRAGDRALAEEIRALRRPSLSAWASNLLVREHPEQVEPLLQLGRALRQAHRELDGPRLRELSHRQRTLIGALARQATELTAEAGHPIGEAARREVEQTLHAVLADPEAARAWAAGRLAKPLTATAGFPGLAEGAAPEPAAAEPATPRRTGRRAQRREEAEEQRRRELAQATEEAEAAERELRAREEEAAEAGRDAEDAARQTAELQQRVSDLADRLRAAQQEQRRARADEQQARKRARDADRRLDTARHHAEEAAARLDRTTTD